MVEVIHAPVFDGTRTLHLTTEGGLPYRDSLVCWCRSELETDDPTSAADDIGMNERRWGVHDEYVYPLEAILGSNDPAPFRRALYIHDEGDAASAEPGPGLGGEPGEPEEVNLRVWLEGVMVYEGQVGIPAGQAWQVGVIDTEAMVFEPAPEGTFVAVPEPWGCVE